MPTPRPDHAAQHGRPAGDVDEVGDQGQRADPEREPEDRHADRQSHRDDRAERQQQDDDRRDQTEDLADPGLRLREGEEQVAAHLDAQRRARRGTCRRSSSMRCRSDRVQLARPPGTAPRSPRPGRRARPSGAPALEHVRQRRRAGRTSDRAAAGVGGGEGGRRGSSGVSTTWAVSPARRRRRRREQLGCLLGVQRPAPAKESSSCLPEGAAAASTTTTEQQPGADDRARGGGRPVDPSDTAACDIMVTPSTDPRCVGRSPT